MNHSKSGQTRVLSPLVKQIEALNGQLGVSRLGEWEKNWSETMSMSPQQFFDVLTDSLKEIIPFILNLRGAVWEVLIFKQIMKENGSSVLILLFQECMELF